MTVEKTEKTRKFIPQSVRLFNATLVTYPTTRGSRRAETQIVHKKRDAIDVTKLFWGDASSLPCIHPHPQSHAHTLFFCLRLPNDTAQSHLLFNLAAGGSKTCEFTEKWNVFFSFLQIYLLYSFAIHLKTHFRILISTLRLCFRKNINIRYRQQTNIEVLFRFSCVCQEIRRVK